jgi:hypothetical protein
VSIGVFLEGEGKVAKQLIKNKEMLAKIVVVNPGEGVEGYSKEVHSVMNVASVVGMTRSCWIYSLPGSGRLGDEGA